LIDILVVGSSGLVGSAILKKLSGSGRAVVGITSKDADLRVLNGTLEILEKYKPKYLIDCAAKVGGIKFNDAHPVDFFLDNIDIQNNLMRAAHKVGVERFVFLGSSCIYPRLAPQPINEDSLMTGPLEPTNSAYAMAKIAGIQLIDSYRKQFGHQWISIMPTNVYGPNDNFKLETSHVIPALISKFVSAKFSDAKEVEIWGTGNAYREFIFSEDLASAVLFCLENYDKNGPINVGTGKEISISKLASLIADIMKFSGEIRFNDLYPDGTPRKLLDLSRINELGWKPKIGLREGLEATIEWYISSLKTKGAL